MSILVREVADVGHYGAQAVLDCGESPVALLVVGRQVLTRETVSNKSREETHFQRTIWAELTLVTIPQYL